jgi:hydroxyethylthiazole kinase-like uncharacterized protein yjeF
VKILSKEQIYQADQITLERQEITSTQLMELAATRVFEWMHSRLNGAPVVIRVFCGIGNNGGDGLVLSRHLVNHGYNVVTYVVNCSNERSNDFLINYERLRQASKKWPELLKCDTDFPEISPDDIIVDAIFGIGLNRPADKWIQKLFHYFRTSKAFTLSIDMPSGLYTDRVPENEDAVVWSHYTLSFQVPKLVFFLPETAKFVDRWEVLDIGLDQDFLNQVLPIAEYIEKQQILPFYKTRDKFSHKGTFGHVLIIGGSYGKIGAVQLASRAALVSGAGLVTAYIPKCGYTAIQTSIPEIMVITDVEEHIITAIAVEPSFNAIGIGVGLGTHPNTVLAFEKFLQKQNAPIVIDADAINILSTHKKLIKHIPALSILTPHPKELERLVGSWKDDFNKIEKVKTFSYKHNLIIVIKGFNTMIIYKNDIYINSTGNPALATAGSGDVLTGIITGLMAQGYEPLQSAIFGVYLHGKSADLLVQQMAYQSIIASDVIDGISNAYIDLFVEPEPTEQSSNGNHSEN